MNPRVVVEIDPVTAHRHLVVAKAVAKLAPSQVALVAAYCGYVQPRAFVAYRSRPPFGVGRLGDSVQTARVGIHDLLTQTFQPPYIVTRLYPPSRWVAVVEHAKVVHPGEVQDLVAEEEIEYLARAPADLDCSLQGPVRPR